MRTECRQASIGAADKQQPTGGDDIPDDLVRRMMKANPIPQPWLHPEDVSRGVLYLVTDPGVITGSVLEIGLGGSARMH